MRFFLIICFAMLVSCNNTNLTDDQCEDLSMKRFKGIPQAASDFKKYCQNREIKYTSKVCMKALQDLVLNSSKSYLDKRYGPKVVGCFTKNDLAKFPLKD